MATPLTADHILAALRNEGVDVAEHPGWRTHNRDAATGKTFGPVNGAVIHHTAGTNSLELCYNGRSDLPGPLCHTHLAKTGVATMVGWGRTNHAGTFAQNAVDAVVAESSVHPAPAVAEPVDGNDKFYGLEIENLGDGKDPYPAVQYDTAVRWAAAICRAHGWSADSVIGHKEGTRRKTDPSFSMTAFRASVNAALALPAGVWGNEGEDMATDLTSAAINAVADAVWAKQLPDGDGDTTTTTSGGAQIGQLGVKAVREEAKVDALAVSAADLTGKVDALAVATATLSSQVAAVAADVEAISVGGVDLDALAAKVADLLATRLAN